VNLTAGETNSMTTISRNVRYVIPTAMDATSTGSEMSSPVWLARMTSCLTTGQTNAMRTVGKENTLTSTSGNATAAVKAVSGAILMKEMNIAPGAKMGTSTGMASAMRLTAATMNSLMEIPARPAQRAVMSAGWTAGKKLSTAAGAHMATL